MGTSAGSIYIDLIIKNKLKAQTEKAAQQTANTVQKSLQKTSKQMEATMEQSNQKALESMKKASEKAAKYQKDVAEKAASSQQKVLEKSLQKQQAATKKAQEKLKKSEQERKAFKEQTEKDIAAAMDRYRQRKQQEAEYAKQQSTQPREPTFYKAQKSSATPKSEVQQTSPPVKDTQAVKTPTMPELSNWNPASNAMDLLKQKLDNVNEQLVSQSQKLQVLRLEYAKLGNSDMGTEKEQKLGDAIQQVQSRMISLQNTALQTENKILQMEQAPIKAAEQAAAAAEKAKQREIAAAERKAAAEERARQREALAAEKAEQRKKAAAERAAQAQQRAEQKAAAAAQKAAQQQIAAAEKAAQKQQQAMEKARASMQKAMISPFTKLTKHLFSIAGSAFIFNGISAALRGMASHFKNAAMSSSEFRNALANLKGAAATAAAPLVNLLTPALTSLANMAATALSYVARLISVLTGKSIASMKASAKATNQYAQSVSGAANQAKELAEANNTLGIDELNVIQPETSSDSGSGGSSGSSDGEVAPNYDFEGQAGIIETAIEKFKNLINTLSQLFAPSMQAWGTAFEKLKTSAISSLDSVKQSALDLWQTALAPLGSFILQDFIPSVINAFSQTFAPIFADVGSFIMEQFALQFQLACQIVGDVINSFLMPLIRLLQQIILDMLSGIQAAWNEYGAPILDAMGKAWESVRDIISNVYETVIKPLLEDFMVQLDWLWSKHLKPLWDNLMEFFGAFAEMVLAIWNEYLAPWIKNMVDVFGPVITTVLKYIMDSFTTSLAVAADVFNAMIQIFKGICKFITGVFTGDWSKAWQGVKDIFAGVWDGIVALLKGAVNWMIDIINTLIYAVTSGLNFVISKLNTLSFDIPDWVPGGLGGKSFGFDIPTITASQIPKLANGGVITQPTLAMMGEYAGASTNPEIVAPESKIRDLLDESMGTMGENINRLVRLLEYQGSRTYTVNQPIEVKLDGQVLYRAMAKVEERQGVKIGGAFAYSY